MDRPLHALFYLQYRAFPAGPAADCALSLMESKAAKELFMIMNLSNAEEAPVTTRSHTPCTTLFLAAVRILKPAAALLAGLALLLSVAGAIGQGQLWFSNVPARTPDYLCDSMIGLSGPQYMAELMAGPTATNLTSITNTPFLSEPWPPGYFNGQVVTVNQLCYCFVQINIWNTNAGPSFEAAKASGRVNAWAQSAVSLTGPLGGPCYVNPATPPAPAGLTSLSLNGPNPPPQIGIAHISSNTLQLYWPVSLWNFMLEQSQDLALTNWTILTNTPIVISTTNFISIPQPTQPTFYRLVLQ